MFVVQIRAQIIFSILMLSSIHSNLLVLLKAGHECIGIIVVKKGKGWISKQWVQENKARQILGKISISYPLIQTRKWSDLVSCNFRFEIHPFLRNTDVAWICFCQHNSRKLSYVILFPCFFERLGKNKQISWFSFLSAKVCKSASNWFKQMH